MADNNRILKPSFSEILDRLTILNIKRFFVKNNILSFSKEIKKIQNDINLHIRKSNILFCSQNFRLIISLAQINLSIWLKKEENNADGDNYLENMKIGHQINGIRNQLKNKILKLNKLAQNSVENTNTSNEDISGWHISALDDNNTLIHNDKGFQTEYHFLLSDLFDRMTIYQIKEMLFEKEKRVKATNKLNVVSHDLDLIIKKKNINVSARIINLIIILALSNNIAWNVKDKMDFGIEDYDSNLDYSNQIIGLRNFILNLLMKEFNEYNIVNKKAIFIYKSIDKNIQSIKKDLDHID